MCLKACAESGPESVGMNCFLPFPVSCLDERSVIHQEHVRLECVEYLCFVMQAACLLALRIPVSLMKGELELSLSSLNEEIEMQCGAWLGGSQLPELVF